MNRDELFLTMFQAYLTNNELRHDVNKGVAMSKGGVMSAIPLMFDAVEAILAEDAKRRDLAS